MIRLNFMTIYILSLVILDFSLAGELLQLEYEGKYCYRMAVMVPHTFDRYRLQKIDGTGIRSQDCEELKLNYTDDQGKSHRIQFAVNNNANLRFLEYVPAAGEVKFTVDSNTNLRVSEYDPTIEHIASCEVEQLIDTNYQIFRIQNCTFPLSKLYLEDIVIAVGENVESDDFETTLRHNSIFTGSRQKLTFTVGERCSSINLNVSSAIFNWGSTDDCNRPGFRIRWRGNVSFHNCFFGIRRDSGITSLEIYRCNDDNQFVPSGNGLYPLSYRDSCYVLENNTFFQLHKRYFYAEELYIRFAEFKFCQDQYLGIINQSLQDQTGQILNNEMAGD